MSAREYHYAGLAEVAALIRERALCPVDLTESMLDRVAAVDPSLKSYAMVATERARSAAGRAADEIAAGRYLGPLHGVPVAVKDLCFTAGVPTRGGLAVYRDFVPDYDGTAVARLEAAGAVLLGKINLTEGAMAGYHPGFDIPVNPWRPDYWSGASSSGSGVAVAAGLCFGALGTDTGGSIRYPAMANGIVGLKPTYGRVSRHGLLGLADSMDHVGPLTRRTRDAAIILGAIAGHDPADPTSLDIPCPDMCGELDEGIAGLRIGIDRAFVSDGTDPGLVTAIEEALATLVGLGAEVVEVAMPEGSMEVQEPWFAICSSEAARIHAEHFPARADEYGPYFRSFLEFGVSVTDEALAAAADFRTRYSDALHALLSEVDALVMPAGGHPFALPCDLYGGPDELQPLYDSVQMHFTIPADLAGTPSLTVPCGLSSSGIPYVWQFVGRRESEPRLCRIGHAYEQATSWHERHPPV